MEGFGVLLISKSLMWCESALWYEKLIKAFTEYGQTKALFFSKLFIEKKSALVRPYSVNMKYWNMNIETVEEVCVSPPGEGLRSVPLPPSSVVAPSLVAGLPSPALVRPRTWKRYRLWGSSCFRVTLVTFGLSMGSTCIGLSSVSTTEHTKHRKQKYVFRCCCFWSFIRISLSLLLLSRQHALGNTMIIPSHANKAHLNGSVLREREVGKSFLAFGDEGERER